VKNLRSQPWVRHLVRAAERYRAERGNHFAASITYFSFLALFPLLMLAFAIGGFVLEARPELLADIKQSITDNVPGDLSGTINDAVDQAIAQRYAVGIVGLLLALYSGIGWMTNLRRALQAQWDQTQQREKFLPTKVRDLLNLLGLGLALVLSLGLTAVGSAFTTEIVKAVGLDDVGWAAPVAKLLALLIALGGDVLVFLWLLKALPRQPVPYRSVFRGAMFAAVGFELLKVFGTYYFKRVNASPAAGVFGSAVGLLVFIFFISRFLLFATAWTATASDDEPSTSELWVDTGAIAPLSTQSSDGPSSVKLVGAGALLGSVATWWLLRGRARR